MNKRPAWVKRLPVHPQVLLAMAFRISEATDLSMSDALELLLDVLRPYIERDVVEEGKRDADYPLWCYGL